MTRYDPTSVRVFLGGEEITGSPTADAIASFTEPAPRRPSPGVVTALAVGALFGAVLPAARPRPPRVVSAEDHARVARAAAKRSRKNAARAAVATVRVDRYALRFGSLSEAERLRRALRKESAGGVSLDVELVAGASASGDGDTRCLGGTRDG